MVKHEKKVVAYTMLFAVEAQANLLVLLGI